MCPHRAETKAAGVEPIMIGEATNKKRNGNGNMSPKSRDASPWNGHKGRKLSRSKMGSGSNGSPPTTIECVRSPKGDALSFSETNMDWSKLNIFRTRLCDRLTQTGVCHMTNRCLFSHDMDWPRRTPFLPRSSALTLRYIPVWCPRLTAPPFIAYCDSSGVIEWSLLFKGYSARNDHAKCPRRDQCPFVHSLEELLYHPEMYKTVSCLLNSEEHRFNEGALCPWYFCPFVHDYRELRNLKDSKRCWHLPPQIVDNEFVALTQGFDQDELDLASFVRRFSPSELFTNPSSPLKKLRIRRNAPLQKFLLSSHEQIHKQTPNAAISPVTPFGRETKVNVSASNNTTASETLSGTGSTVPTDAHTDGVSHAERNALIDPLVVLVPRAGSSLEAIKPTLTQLKRISDGKLAALMHASFTNLLYYSVENFYVPALLSLQCALLHVELNLKFSNPLDAKSLYALAFTVDPRQSASHQHFNSVDRSSADPLENGSGMGIATPSDLLYQSTTDLPSSLQTNVRQSYFNQQIGGFRSPRSNPQRRSVHSPINQAQTSMSQTNLTAQSRSFTPSNHQDRFRLRDPSTFRSLRLEDKQFDKPFDRQSAYHQAGSQHEQIGFQAQSAEQKRGVQESHLSGSSTGQQDDLYDSGNRVQMHKFSGSQRLNNSLNQLEENITGPSFGAGHFEGTGDLSPNNNTNSHTDNNKNKNKNRQFSGDEKEVDNREIALSHRAQDRSAFEVHGLKIHGIDGKGPVNPDADNQVAEINVGHNNFVGFRFPSNVSDSNSRDNQTSTNLTRGTSFSPDSGSANPSFPNMWSSNEKFETGFDVANRETAYESSRYVDAGYESIKSGSRQTDTEDYPNKHCLVESACLRDPGNNLSNEDLCFDNHPSLSFVDESNAGRSGLSDTKTSLHGSGGALCENLSPQAHSILNTNNLSANIGAHDHRSQNFKDDQNEAEENTTIDSPSPQAITDLLDLLQPDELLEMVNIIERLR